MKSWNDTIFGNATTWSAMDPVVYYMDGDSGILDNAREVKERIKAFAYAYRMTNNSAWVDRAWEELQVRSSSCSEVDIRLIIERVRRMLLVTAPTRSVQTTTSGILLISSTPANSPLHSPLAMTGSTICGRTTRKR